MSTHVYVAAGGGGDALAALLVHHALGRAAERAVVMSYSWDRFVVDPAPGPRSADDFSNLGRIAASCWEVNAESRLRWPASPTLPLLARHANAQMILLDPHQGANAMRQSIAECTEAVHAKDIVLVDVGGDAIATGHEDDLRSPLADSLAMAALAEAGRPVTVVVVGPGLDGELPANHVQEECDRLSTDAVTITPDAVTTQQAALREHPSEATALLAAAALGIRGSVETRDRGSLVPLTEESASAHLIAHERALQRNRLAQRLMYTTSLREAEEVTLDECGRCELTYEREKAAAKTDGVHQDPSPVQIAHRLLAYRDAARARGASHGTFRRTGEMLGLPGYAPERLRALVGNAHSYLSLYPL